MRVYENRVCQCGKLQTVRIAKTSHALHGVMSIITCGVWLVVWLIAAMENSIKQHGKCACGKKL
jgi:hypothetical protein